MRILVMSDTHGDTYFWENIKKYVEKADLVLHAGDVLYHGPRNPLPTGYSPARLAELLNSLNIPVIISKGNCDADVDQLVLKYPLLSPYSFIFIPPWRILLMHGEDKDEETLWKISTDFRVNLLIFGHIHTPVLKKGENGILLNPGSPALPKTSYKTIGFIEDKEISIIDITKDEIIEKLSL
ncbi:MAG: phosphodiesterase [Dictyoglomaceae bacterium]